MQRQQKNSALSETIGKEGLASVSGSRQLNIYDIRNVAQGACFLASGGGGSLQCTLTKIIPACFTEQSEIYLIGIEALIREGDWGGVVAGMGSPLTLFNDPALVKAAVPVYQKLAELCVAFKAAGQPKYQSLLAMNFCIPGEIGAANTIVPMIVADALKIAVADADGAGRAVPTLSLCTYARQIDLYPNILGGYCGTEQETVFNFGSFGVPDEETMEAACLAMIGSGTVGDVSCLGIYAANGPAFRMCNPVPNGIRDSLEIGTIIGQTAGADRLKMVLGYIGNTMGRTAKQIFYGQVTDMKQSTQGLDTGYAIITGAGLFKGKSFELFIENENIWGALNGTPWIVSPDSMNYLTDTGDVFDNSDLWKMYENGGRPTVSVIGIRAADQILGNEYLMQEWAQTVKSKGGPDSYISPWI